MPPPDNEHEYLPGMELEEVESNPAGQTVMLAIDRFSVKLRQDLAKEAEASRKASLRNRWWICASAIVGPSLAASLSWILS